MVDGSDYVALLDPGAIRRTTAHQAVDERTLPTGIGRLDTHVGAVRVGHPAVLDQLSGDVLGEVARNREADAGRGATDLRIGRSQCGYPDHLTREVDERAATVPGVDGGAGLDHSGQCCATRFGHGPA